ncbi:aminopeptidase [Sutcliffiella horikoshii]|uniref:Aminopeptidase n=1 Tax=Sutcliffiella horikoshii TaxID=79883 RepID=A0A5D4T3R4_9BACI|nr:aminopeptidase [Sutcliffiella horikoshii]TYS70340.1 aminopeptidase [Sutcliffiella horikoshii]
MSNLHTTMEKYAELAVKVGVNVQKGQTLIVNADIATAPFVRLVTKKAYEAGAKLVQIEWTDEQVTRIRYDEAPEESFEYFPSWRAEMFEKAYEEGAAMLAITSVNPDLLKGVDASKIANLQKAAGEATKGYRKMVMADKISWSIVAVPSKGWSAKVFPDLSENEQEEKLWEAIFHATRANLEDPVKAWMEHKEKLSEKVEFLNNKKFKSLHYKAEGTDLTIDLAEKHVWIGPESINENGVAFIANMPTEEVFTTPLKTGVNGTVRSSKPLNYGGNMIDNFSITFENGRIVSFEAEEGHETLQKLIETDEGSHYLGEVALVPHDSPISNTNLIFYNTLFDENASHHLAIGNAYSFALEGGKQMSEEELEAAGANSSITHVDFMIGSSDMDIDGITKDGERVPLFRQGNWA